MEAYQTVIKATGVESSVSPDMYCHWYRKKEKSYRLKKSFAVKYTKNILRLCKCCTICVKETSLSLCSSAQGFMFPSFLFLPLLMAYMSCVYGPKGKTHKNTASALRNWKFVQSKDSICWVWYTFMVNVSSTDFAKEKA